MDVFKLKFDGYWRDEKKANVPSQSGIYCVYACSYHPPRNSNKGTVSIRRLLYVGESENVNSRISNHEKEYDWKRHLRVGETLCFSFAPIVTDRVQAEASIINRHKPIENTEYVNSFPFRDTSVTLTGETAELENSFVVKSTKYRGTYY